MGTKVTGIYFRGTTPLDRLAKSARFIIFSQRLQDEIQQLLSKPRFPADDAVSLIERSQQLTCIPS